MAAWPARATDALALFVHGDREGAIAAALAAVAEAGVELMAGIGVSVRLA